MIKSLPPEIVARMLGDDGTFGTCLHIIALCAYGEEIYTLDMLELLQRLEEDFRVRVTDANENKLNAMLLAVSTEAFHRDPEAFRSVCETLTNGDPGLDLLDTLTVSEMAFGLYEVEISRGPEELAPPVQALFDRVVEQETNDDPEQPDDPYGHVWPYLRERHGQMVRQLQDLGVDTLHLPPMESPTATEGTSAL